MIANKTPGIVKIVLLFLSLLWCMNSYAIQATKTKNVTCKGSNDGEAQLIIKGGNAPFQYTFAGPSTLTGTMTARGSKTIGGLMAGVYTITVEDKNKCISTGSVSIGKDNCPPDPFTIPVVAGGDPNDITGPVGYEAAKWVSVNDVLLYKIRFENDPKIATAAVNKVIVTHPIDKMANMFTFRLGNISFRNFVVEVPPNKSYFFKRLDLVDSIGVYLDITAGLDVTKKQAFWIFQAFDAVTGLPNINPNLGFLLINDTITHNGEGAVNFSIKPKTTAKTGDTIKAYADIIFDVNATIRTNTAFNTIDAYSPLSKIKSAIPLDAENVKLTWEAHEDAGGSGLAKYKLLVATNNDPYTTYADDITDTSFILPVLNGNKYKLQTIAIDQVKNTEQIQSEPDTIIEIKADSFFITPAYASKTCAGNPFEVRWKKINDIQSMSLQLSADSGKTYTSLGENILISDSVFSWNIPLTLAGNHYYKMRAVNSANQLAFASSNYFLIKNTVNVQAGADRELCPNDSVLIGGNPTASNGIEPYIFKWSPSENLNFDSVPNPYLYLEGSYILKVTDSIGCFNSDTIKITTHSLPNVYVHGLDSSYYSTSVKDTLYGSPENGVFSGAGITGSLFDPSLAGTGTHTIIYTYTNEYGCSARAVAHTKVVPAGNAIIQGLDSAYCINASPATLTGNPSGGVFRGSGMVNNTFNPSLAGIGTHEIKYTYSDSAGTPLEATAKTTVYPLPVVSFNGLDTLYCVNADTVELLGAPIGGTFSGNGISGNKFIAAAAGSGTHLVTYSFTDENGCSGNQTKSVIINNLPLVSFSGLDTQYCVSADTAKLTGIPAGGVFSGNGISGNSFIPSTAGLGLHQITYSYTDQKGCSNKQTQAVQVNNFIAVSFTGLDSQYCVNADTVKLTGIPAGGIFSGAGISGTTFSPSIAGLGIHQITYSYSDQNGCSNTYTQTVTVNEVPQVSFSGLNTQYCINADTVHLTGSPAGGTFSGNGISGNSFIPSTAGLGLHQITYSYIDQSGCSNKQTQAVQVNNFIVVSFTGLDSEYCVNADTVQLTGSPAGGTFSGTGIIGNRFIPSLAGLGIHQITYSYSDQNGCSNTYAQTVTVNELPQVSFSGLNTQYCINADTVQLTGSPGGGTFSGTGIIGNHFIPSLAGPGNHLITYSYAGNGTCSGFLQKSVLVNELPQVSFSGLDLQYCVNADTVKLTGIPAGGTFSGMGISGTTFSPSIAGLGIHQITYSYSDQNGCSNTYTQTVTVNEVPQVSFSGLNTQYCINADTVHLTGSPAGGTFSGTGIIGNHFIPYLAGLGIHQITYSYSNQNGCSNNYTQTVTVNGMPQVSFSGLNAQYCINADTVHLTGIPPGGTFTGNGISGNTFNAAIAGIGVHQISYSYIDQNGCTNTQIQSVLVNPNPTIHITPVNPFLCNGDSVTLTANGSSGYVWSTGATTASIIVSPGITTTYTVIGTHMNGCTSMQSATVTVNPNPVISITPVNPSLCTGTSVTLTASGSSSYTWNTGAITASITVSPNVTTTYTVTGTNDKGCTTMQVTVVTINPNSVISITPAGPSLCNGSSATLTASGSSSYTWNTGATTASITVSPNVTTTYTVTGTNTNGCTSMQATAVTVNPNPVISITPANPSLCNGSSVTLTASGAGISGIYKWNTGATTASIAVSPNVTTTYTVTGTNTNGCTSMQATAVTVNPNPLISITPANPSLCNGSSVTLTASGAGISGIYKWNTGATTASITVSPNKTTTYTVTGTNLNGCTNTQVSVVTINPTIAIHPISPVLCSGSTATLTATGAGNGGSYKWSTGATTAFITVSPNVTTTYTVIGRNSNGCTNSQSVVVTVNSKPLITITPANSSLCDGSSVTLTANGASSYVWHTGETTASILVSPSITTTYTVVGTNGAGCTNAQSTRVTVIPRPDITITPVNPSICSGSTVKLTAHGAGNGGSYKWNTGATTKSIFVSPVTSTTYTVTGTNSAGCTNSQITVVTPNPIIVISPSSATLCIGNSITLTASGAGNGGNYKWSTGAKTKSITVSPRISTTYTVTGKTRNGCKASAISIITVDNCRSLTKETDNDSPEAQYFNIYPNPAEDKITVDLHLLKESQGRIEILDMLGKKVKQVKQGLLTNEKVEVDVYDLPAGIYYIQIVLEYDVLINKLIIN